MRRREVLFHIFCAEHQICDFPGYETEGGFVQLQKRFDEWRGKMSRSDYELRVYLRSLIVQSPKSSPEFRLA